MRQFIGGVKGWTLKSAEKQHFFFLSLASTACTAVAYTHSIQVHESRLKCNNCTQTTTTGLYNTAVCVEEVCVLCSV
jgi:hypothetical protein